MSLMKIKVPVITPPPPPPAQYDYDIEIQQEIIVKDKEGNVVAELASLDDLNQWLRSVTNKRIHIWSNLTAVEGTLELSENTYYIEIAELESIYIAGRE